MKKTIMVFAVIAGAWLAVSEIRRRRENAGALEFGEEVAADAQEQGAAGMWELLGLEKLDGSEIGIVEGIGMRLTQTLELWRPPEKYAPAIAAAEQRHGIPRDMLARLLYQESRYREDIITGRVKSPVGALGIAQFMPATAQEMGIDPLEPMQAIDGAGRYLARLYRASGTWAKALAAYNWGLGNVQRKGMAKAPAETRNYYAQILNDINAANGTALA